MGAGHRSHAAVDGGPAGERTFLVQPVAGKAGAGPVPDIATDVEQTVLVLAEAAERPGLGLGHDLAARLLVVAGEPAVCDVAARILAHGIVHEARAGGIGPFLVARQAPVAAGLLRQPGGIVAGVVPGDAD